MTQDELRKSQRGVLAAIMALQDRAEELGMAQTLGYLNEALKVATLEYATFADPEKTPTLQVKAAKG